MHEKQIKAGDGAACTRERADEYRRTDRLTTDLTDDQTRQRHAGVRTDELHRGAVVDVAVHDVELF